MAILGRIRIRALLIAAFMTLGCVQDQRAKEERREEPLKVKFVAAQERARAGFLDMVGSVQPKLHATLSAKVPGHVMKINATPGKMVKSGDVLVELEAEEIKAKVDQARAVYRQAETELKRATNLLSQNAITHQDFESARMKEQVARSGLGEAETMLGYVKITAPFDGVISQKLTEIGDLAAPGKPLLEIVSPNELRFEAEVPEALISTVKIGDSLPVTVDRPAAELAARVTEINPTADPFTRTFTVKLDFPAGARLAPGQFGRLRMPVSESTALEVPASSLAKRGQLEFLYVLKDGRAQLRLVRSGKRLGESVQILSGLDPDEEVATGDVSQLIDQQRVEALH